MRNLIPTLWLLAFDNGDGGDGGGDGGNKGGEKPKTFTQEEVNSLLAKNKRELKETNERLAGELETLKKNKSLTDEEREHLDSQIKALRNEKVTTEETLKSELQKTKKELTESAKKLSEERDAWKNRFTTSTIRNSLMEAASKAKAFSPSQVVELLNSKTELVEEVDGEGKPTGNFTPKVKMNIKKDGKDVTLVLAPDDALKQMKEDVDTYGNLFVTDLKGGLGGSNGGGSRKDVPAGKHVVKKGDTAAYSELRRKGIKSDDIIIQ